MIKKLRIKFILLSMGAFLLVLAVIVTFINVVNYNSVVREADELLAILSENRGAFPNAPGGGAHHLPPNMSPEIPYESRYFSVILAQGSQTVLQTETSRIASVDKSHAVMYAKKAIQSDNNIGFVDNFRYITRTEDALVRITFLDCGRKLDSFQDFLFASVFISLSGYLVVLALISFFSNRIIRPISESYEKQKSFITDASHEMKTPLTIIHADADVLSMELGDNEWLVDIQKQTKRLSSLTNDLVLLSRMDEGKNQLHMIDFPFSDVVDDVILSFQALAQTQNKTFEHDIQPMLTLCGDEKAIRQLVNILLDNALKYSPANGYVSIKAKKQNKWIQLSVFNTTEDQISKDSLPYLFERFYRADPSRNSQTGGYGIGLSVAKAIATAHNGKIQATSKDINTLQITVSLPINNGSR